jgi:ABC-2 type transport system permease protein
MSTAAPVIPLPTAKGRRAPETRPGLARLTRIELRKMVDTRAGFWLLMSVAGLMLVVVGVTVANRGSDATFVHTLSNALVPASTLLPVVGILLVCSEWSQRTALVTFALVPQRGRVLAAKVAASVAVAVAAFVVAVPLAAIGTLAVTSADDAWTLPAALVGQDLLALVSAMLIGVAFGAVILSPAPAIVAMFVVPVALMAIGSIGAIESAVPWVDQWTASEPLTEHLLSGREWGRLATSSLLWLAVPLAAGVWRFRNAEIR